MYKNKKAFKFYELFYGIYDSKLYIQIVNEDRKIEYSFESENLDYSSDKKDLLISIMVAIDKFFGYPFVFEENLILGIDRPLLERHEGRKIINGSIVNCKTFEGLPAFNTIDYIDSHLPFEKLN